VLPRQHIHFRAPSEPDQGALSTADHGRKSEPEPHACTPLPHQLYTLLQHSWKPVTASESHDGFEPAITVCVTVPAHVTGSRLEARLCAPANMQNNSNQSPPVDPFAAFQVRRSLTLGGAGDSLCLPVRDRRLIAQDLLPEELAGRVTAAAAAQRSSPLRASPADASPAGAGPLHLGAAVSLPTWPGPLLMNKELAGYRALPSLVRRRGRHLAPGRLAAAGTGAQALWRWALQAHAHPAPFRPCRCTCGRPQLCLAMSAGACIPALHRSLRGHQCRLAAARHCWLTRSARGWAAAAPRRRAWTACRRRSQTPGLRRRTGTETGG